MKLENYPKYTIIMRGYSYAQSEAILLALEHMEHEFAVEVTLNTPDALLQIEKLANKFGDKISIGAGTVRNLTDVQKSIEAGATFLLGPHAFTLEMFKLAKKNKILCIPSAMTPTEIDNMFDAGADIVKVFPAGILSPKFFNDVQAPLGKLPLMAVGGITTDNALSFLNQGATYLGLGSGMFNPVDIETLNVANLSVTLKEFLNLR